METVRIPLTLSLSLSPPLSLSPALSLHRSLSVIGFENYPVAIAQSAGGVDYLCPGYDTKPSDGEVSVILDMQSTPLLSSLQVPL